MRMHRAGRLRAVRLFAQSQLAQAVLSTGETVSDAWNRLIVEFSGLTTNYGQRWTEVPWEATLTAGWAAKLLAELTPLLIRNESQQTELLRTATVRFSCNGASDVTVTAPLISWLLDNKSLEREWGIDEAESVRRQVLRWLRGVARLDFAGDDSSSWQELRVRIRDALVQCSNKEYTDHDFVESLGLLGTNSNDASNQLLVSIGKDQPSVFGASRRECRRCSDHVEA